MTIRVNYKRMKKIFLFYNFYFFFEKRVKIIYNSCSMMNLLIIAMIGVIANSETQKMLAENKAKEYCSDYGGEWR